jgi:ABC-2 type transport system ATP-binding protein
MRLFAGRTLIHVWGDNQPDNGFEAVTPDLEDVYFATIRGFTHPTTSGPEN